MLSRENIELLCRVGPGTPMGNLMREYWLPLVYSWEIEPDGEPKRVRILGENLIAFRDSEGKPGFVAESCPHRGASMFFGRNEESGLRCVYHGWKFDVEGACADMPNEPAESNFKHKIRITAYKAADAGRVTWIYMGPHQDTPPALPQWEWCTLPEAQVQHQHKGIYQCNYMQALEGELDTTHVYFLHSRLDPSDLNGYGLYAPDKAARLDIVDTDYGVMYAARRLEDSANIYWRSTQFLFPIYGMFPGGGEDGTVPLSIYLPIDDYNTMHWGLRWHPSKALAGDGKPTANELNTTGVLSGGVGPMRPHQYGKAHADWWPEAAPDNDFLVNRDVQKTKNFTGIGSVRMQDHAVIWSMGSIMDRTREHLGTADATIIRVRRRMLAAAEALRDHGVTPPGVGQPELYKRRSVMAILPAGEDWKTRFAAWHEGSTTEHPTGGFAANVQRAIPEGGRRTAARD